MTNVPETLFETRWLGIYRIGHWDFTRRPNADACVAILALTPADEVVLVEQFRVPVQQRVIDIPAGLVGDEEEHRGEALAATAGRELLEEAGFRAGRIEELHSSPTSPGMTSEFTYLFLATELTQEHAGGGVGGEDITVHLVPRASLRSWLKEKEAAGCAIDYKMFAALWAAGL